MWWTTIPKAILTSFILIVIVWDLAAGILGHPEATFSRVLLDASENHPIIAFIFGMVCGHVWWSNN